MTIAIKGGEIVKQDSKGRKRTPKERQEVLLAEYDRSGMTGAAFARGAGIQYATFMTWLQKRRLASETSGKKGQEGVALEWVEAEVENSAEAPLKRKEQEKQSDVKTGVGLVVEAPGGIRLELNEEKHVMWAAKLLRHLGEAC